jgi:hypothetical protein
MGTIALFWRLLAPRRVELRRRDHGSGNRMRVPRLVPMATAVVVAGTSVWAPASAARVDVTCAGTETVKYEPGLLLSPQTVSVTVNGMLSPCTSSDSGIKTGTYLHNFTATLSCDTLFAPLAATRVFQWSNGRSSTFVYKRAIDNAGGQTTVTFTGTITSGEFSGDPAVEQVVLVTPNSAQCLAPPGLTTLGPGPATLSITSP